MASMYLRSQRKRMIVTVLSYALFILLSACSGGGGSEDTSDAGQGEITFNLEIENGQASARSLRAEADGFDCQGNHIATIEAFVYNEAEEELAFGGPWECVAGKGTVSGVEAGSDRGIEVLARDDSGVAIFKGNAEGLTVITGQTTDAGTVVLFPIINRQPKLAFIENQEVREGETLKFTVTATDSDADNILTFDTGDLPSGATFDSATHTFSWTPGFDDAGVYTITFTVTDDGEPPLSDTMDVKVVVEGINQRPEFEAIGDQVVKEGNVLEFRVLARDPDIEDTLTYGAENLPIGADFDPETQTFTWTPGFEAAGIYTVTFTVTDDGEPPLSDTMEVKIAVGGINQLPEFEAIGDQVVKEGDVLEFRVVARDPDIEDTLTYGAENLPDGADFDPDTQTFTWTPGFDAAGTYAVTFTVTDNGEEPLQDVMNVTTEVVNVNRAPVFGFEEPAPVNEGEVLEFKVLATDPDSDALTYEADKLPDGANFNSETQVFTWTPGFEDAGTYVVEVMVTDNGSPPMSTVKEVTIVIGQGNRPPVLSVIGSKTADVSDEQGLEFMVTATDADGDNLDYSVSAPLPSGASFDSQVFSWNPGVEDVGNYTIRFTVTDDNQENPLSDFEDVAIQVVNGAPVVISTSPSGGETEVNLDTAIEVTFSEPMNLSSINEATLLVVEAGVTTPLSISGNITYEGQDKAIFTPLSPLSVGMTYEVTVSADVTDLSDIPMGTDFTWSFTTNAAPFVVSRDPASGETGVEPLPTITAVFSEPMDPATINGDTFRVSFIPIDSIDRVFVDGTADYDDTGLTAMFTPESSLSELTTYEVRISGEVTDLSGIPIAGGKGDSWAFTTSLF